MKFHLIGTLVINWLLISVILIQSSVHCIRKNHGNKAFKALPNVYKANPLRHSGIYLNFFNCMLAARSDQAARAILNFDSNESTRLKEKRTGAELRRIESIIRHSEGTTTISDVTGCLVDSSTPETFMTSSIFNDNPYRKDRNVLHFDLYDTGNEVTQGNAKIIVSNVNGGIFSDTSLDNVYPQRSLVPNEWEEVNSALELVSTEVKRITQNANHHNENILVVR